MLSLPRAQGSISVKELRAYKLWHSAGKKKFEFLVYFFFNLFSLTISLYVLLLLTVYISLGWFLGIRISSLRI